MLCDSAGGEVGGTRHTTRDAESEHKGSALRVGLMGIARTDIFRIGAGNSSERRAERCLGLVARERDRARIGARVLQLCEYRYGDSGRDDLSSVLPVPLKQALVLDTAAQKVEEGTGKVERYATTVDSAGRGG